MTFEPEHHKDCREKLQEAKDLLTKVADKAGYAHAATIDYGKVLHRLGEEKRAYDVLNKCVENGSSHTRIKAHECLGKCYEAKRDYSSAINEYLKAENVVKTGVHNYKGKFYADRLKVLRKWGHSQKK